MTAPGYCHSRKRRGQPAHFPHDLVIATPRGGGISFASQPSYANPLIHPVRAAQGRIVSCDSSKPQLTFDDQFAAIPLKPAVLGKLPASPRLVRVPSG